MTNLIGDNIRRAGLNSLGLTDFRGKGWRLWHIMSEGVRATDKPWRRESKISAWEKRVKI